MLNAAAQRTAGAVSKLPGGPVLIAGLRQSVARYGAAQLMLANLAYVAGLGAYKLAGLRFGVGMPETVFQFMPSSMLQHDYFRTIWYLHAQPPLFNAWMGAVQKWSPLSVGLSYHLTFLALGWMMLCGLIVIARALGLGRTAAAVVGVVISLAPPVVMFQHWFFYDFPMAALVTATVALASVWVRVRRARWAFATMATGAAVVLTRSMMHPLWLVGIAVLILIAWRPSRGEFRSAVLSLSVPLLLVGGVMLKNQILFGTPQLSSWFGLNLYRTVVFAQPAEVRDEWAKKYELDTLAPTPPCSSPYPGVPVLDEQFKAPGILNWNWYCEIARFKHLESVSYEIIRHEPRAVARGVVGSAELWFSTTDFWVGLDPGRKAIEPASRVWRNIVGWDRTWNPPVATSSAFVGLAPDKRFHLSLSALLSAAIVYGAGLAAIRPLFRRRRRVARPRDGDLDVADSNGGHVPSVRTFTTVVTTWTVGFSFLVGTMFEHGENARFRFVTEPLTLCAAVALAAGAIGPRTARWWQARNATAASAAAES